MLLVCASLLIFQSWSGKLYNDPEQLHLASYRNQFPVLYRHGCDDWYLSTRVRLCIFGDKTSDKRVVLIGDSILMQWFPAVANWFVNRNWQLIALTKSSCPMVNRSFFLKRINTAYRVCDIWREQAVKTIINLKPQVVIMGSSTNYPFSKTDWQDGTREILDQLVPYVGQIRIIAGTPRLGFDGPACLARRAWLSRFLPDLSDTSCSRKLNPSKTWAWLNEVVSGYPSVQLIEPSNIICPDHFCSARIKDTIIFRDDQHLSIDFVLGLTDFLGEKLHIK